MLPDFNFRQAAAKLNPTAKTVKQTRLYAKGVFPKRTFE
jgi:hypothetical protein